MKNDSLWKEHLYDRYVSTGQGKSVESSFAGRVPYLSHVIARHLTHLTSDSYIVDIGCGNGLFLYTLKQAGFVNIAGVDISPEQVAHAHQLGVKEVTQGSVAQFLELLPAKSVGAFVCMDILEHLERHELLTILDQMRHALKSGGVCLFHLPNAEGVFGSRVRYADLTHELSFTSQSIGQACRAAGFVKVNCYEDRPVVHGGKSLLRRIIYEFVRVPFWLFLMAETGQTQFCLSQNMIVVAQG